LLENSVGARAFLRLEERVDVALRALAQLLLLREPAGRRRIRARELHRAQQGERLERREEGTELPAECRRVDLATKRDVERAPRELAVCDERFRVVRGDDLEPRNRKREERRDLREQLRLLAEPRANLRSAGDADDPLAVHLEDRVVPATLDLRHGLDGDSEEPGGARRKSDGPNASRRC